MVEDSEGGEFADNSITEEELLLAARGLVEHAAKVPRLFDELLTSVAELSDEDIGLIATALD